MVTPLTKRTMPKPYSQDRRPDTAEGQAGKWIDLDRAQIDNQLNQSVSVVKKTETKTELEIICNQSWHVFSGVRADKDDLKN